MFRNIRFCMIANTRDGVLALLEQPAPAGMSHWDGPAVAEKLDSSVHAVWRVLRREGIHLLAIIQKRIFLNIGRPSLRRIAKLEAKIVEIPGRQWVAL